MEDDFDSWRDRPQWNRHIEFIITCVGAAVGLGNVWRFPYLVYKHGGGAFLIPYVCSLFFMGIPLFCLELFLGQFSSLGPTKVWEINPMFKGIGWMITIITSIIIIYYNVVVSIALYFLFASMSDYLPWTTCGNEWNTCACRTSRMNRTLSDPLMWYKSAGLNCSECR